MWTLQTFYHSKEWEKLLKIIKLERVDANGQLICAHCGKPITRAYDCIGHHVNFLTEENVNDRNISLNPENIQLVHHGCHNKIHEKWGSPKREVFLVYGSPLSGKTTYVSQIMQPGDLIMDMDRIWECISGQPTYIKPGRLNAVAFAVRDEIMNAIRYKVGKWQHAYIIGGFPLVSERERIIQELGARPLYIDTAKEECISRLMQCTDMRNKEEWLGYIENWWKRYAPLSESF